jgi:hypothetical protein
LALSHGNELECINAAHHRTASLVDYRSRCQGQPRREEVTPTLGSLNEANVLAFSLQGSTQSAIAGNLANLGLGHDANGEQDAFELLGLEHPYYVGLILSAIDTSDEAVVTIDIFDASMVTRCYCVVTQAVSNVKERPEL